MKLEPITLTGRHVRLEPLAEVHKDGLRAACAADPDTWNNLYPYSMLGEQFDVGWARMARDAEAGTLIPFAVVVDGACVGQTCYITPSAENRSVEIGGTYYDPSVRGGPVNPECKRLLLGHAFDAGAMRVWFKVDAINTRSRAAVLKLGAVEEGVLRRDRITWTGRIRDTAFYSILDDEWPAVRARLDARLATLVR